MWRAGIYAPPAFTAWGERVDCTRSDVDCDSQICGTVKNVFTSKRAVMSRNYAATVTSDRRLRSFSPVTFPVDRVAGPCPSGVAQRVLQQGQVWLRQLGITHVPYRISDVSLFKTLPLQDSA